MSTPEVNWQLNIPRSKVGTVIIRRSGADDIIIR
jgi:hypothetical protein